MPESYLTLADPRERSITVDTAYDAILCTGDILDLAPPPSADPQGSVLASHRDTVADLYADHDVEGILDAVQGIGEDPAVRADARDRYERFFEQVETPFYYVAGNQDLPAVLDEVASRYNEVRHVSTVEGWTGIDGLIPSVTGTLAGTFPCEVDRATFEAELTAGELLVAHALPDDADLSSYTQVIASAPDGEPTRERENVLELAPWPGDYRILSL